MPPGLLFYTNLQGDPRICYYDSMTSNKERGLEEWNAIWAIEKKNKEAIEKGLTYTGEALKELARKPRKAGRPARQKSE